LDTVEQLTRPLDKKPSIQKEVKRMTQAVLKRVEVTKFTGLCYSTIWNMEKKGQFPARRKLSAGRVGWLRSEVEEWIQGRAAVALPVEGNA
jgi:prophage regulatory protein